MQNNSSFFDTEVDLSLETLDIENNASSNSGFGFGFDDYEFVKIEPITFDTFNEQFEDSESYEIEVDEADFNFTTQISLYDEDGDLDVVFTNDPNSFTNSLVESNSDLDLDLDSGVTESSDSDSPASSSSSSTFLANFNEDLFADDRVNQSSLIDLDSDSTYGSISKSNAKNILGDSSNNLLVSDNSDNAIQGFAGDDYLAGNGGADSLTGGSGDDYLTGGLGDDTLVGGSSSSASEYDDLQGGLGADTFVIGDRSDPFYEGNGYATITDFSKSEDDLIQLHGSSSDYSFTEIDGGLQIRYDGDLVAEVNGIESLGSDELNFV